MPKLETLLVCKFCNSQFVAVLETVWWGIGPHRIAFACLDCGRVTVLKKSEEK